MYDKLRKYINFGQRKQHLSQMVGILSDYYQESVQQNCMEWFKSRGYDYRNVKDIPWDQHDRYLDRETPQYNVFLDIYLLEAA